MTNCVFCKRNIATIGSWGFKKGSMCNDCEEEMLKHTRFRLINKAVDEIKEKILKTIKTS